MTDKKRSKALRGELADILRAELLRIASQPVRTLLPPARARRIVRDLAPQELRGETLGEIAVQVHRSLEKRLRATRESPSDLLGADFAATVEKLFDEDLLQDGATEELMAFVLRQEFVRKLLTEVIHTSIVSFYKRVNPLFGGLATTMLEDQIRGFISMFMPMIQEQAVRFAIGKRNQAFVRDLGRSLAAHMLATPLADLVPAVAAPQRKRLERIIRDNAADAVLRARIHAVAVIVWDAAYEAISDRKLREVVNLEALATPLADAAADLLSALLARPAVSGFLREQLGTAPAPRAAAKAPARRPKATGRGAAGRARRAK